MKLWVVQRREMARMFGDGDPHVSWILFSVSNGEATQHATFDDEAVARRVAELLTRNGMIDAPLVESSS